MTLIQEMGYAAYGVRDLEQSVEFFRNVCQLEVSERTDDTVFLTGDNRHHWVRLEKREESGLLRLGYRAVNAAAVDEVTRRLGIRGTPYERVENLAGDRVTGGVRFTAPDGVPFEIYERMLTLPASPAPDRGIACLLHGVVFVPDAAASTDFYTDVLGMLVSDRIEDVITFLRCGNQYHHSLAVARGGTGELDHIAMLVDDLEDVLAFRAHGQIQGKLAGEIVKHVASNSVSVYLQHIEEKIGVEYCNGHGKIADDAYSGRLIKAHPRTVNAWAAGFPLRAAVDPIVGTSMSATAGGGTAAGAAGMSLDAELELAER